MEHEELEARLARAEANISRLAEIVSGHSAANSAFTASLIGVLHCLRGTPGVADAVYDQLERSQATSLGLCINEASVQALAEYSEVLTAALGDPRGPVLKERDD